MSLAAPSAASYALPASTPGGTYTIKTVYNGTSNFQGSSDTSHVLTVNAAATVTVAANVSATFNTAGQLIPLTATITSAAGTVDEGTETFTILSGTTVLGSPVTVNVAAGAAAGNYTLPGGTAAGSYTIQAVYHGTGNFVASTDNSHFLNVSASTTVSSIAVEWGSEAAPLQFASDGIRLLPVGRTTDLPWYDINRIALTLKQAEVLNPGDVSVTGLIGGNYGPVTISGSGTTSLVITFAKPIARADRVTITIGNAQIATFTGRLDVLPGDVNDDGYVNVTDGTLILANPTPAHAYNVFYDFNGDGVVNMTDFTLYRPFIGTTLPALPQQLAAGGEGPGGAALLTTNELAPVLSAAIHDWAAAGLPAQDVALLQQVTVQITNLPSGYLGTTAIGGTIVYLSADAAGYGWFIDSAPGMPAPIAGPVTATEQGANTSAAAVGHEDLLTVVTHELGHTLGLSDLGGNSNDLMATTLATGVQRLPSAQDVAAVVALQSPAGQAAPVAGPAPALSTVLTDAVFGAAPGVSANLQGLSVVPVAPPHQESLSVLLAALLSSRTPSATILSDTGVAPDLSPPLSKETSVSVAGTVPTGLTDRLVFLDVALTIADLDKGVQPEGEKNDLANWEV